MCQKATIDFYLCQSGALYVFDRPEFFGEFFTIFVRDGFLLVFLQFFYRVPVVPQVDLSSDKQEWNLLAMMSNLRYPLE